MIYISLKDGMSNDMVEIKKERERLSLGSTPMIQSLLI